MRWWQNALPAFRQFVRTRLPSWEGTSQTAGLTTRDIGDRGEKAAERYLRRNGYTIIERNWWAPHRRGEIDIVATIDGVIVAVEVKSYPRGSLTPGEAFPPRKRRKLVSLIEQYARQGKHFNCTLRVDLVAVEWAEDGKVAHIDHIESAATAADA